MSYSPAQEAVLRAAEPITFEGAGTLAAELGVTRGSVIAKALSMELEYIRKPATPKRPRGATKSEIVAEIAATLGTNEVEAIAGLVKAPGSALNALLNAIS